MEPGAADWRAEARAAASREAALAVFRRHLAQSQFQVRDAFETHRMAGVAAAGQLAALADETISALLELAHHSLNGNGGPPPAIAVIATGGYGRALLAPFSDIDLLFLTGASGSPAGDHVVEYLLYFLWDLGLRVGHATRSVPECVAAAVSDHTVRTALLDARLVAGEAALFGELEGALREMGGTAAFIAAKSAERAERHRRFGESAFLVEPNVKEGRGGLRDLQTLYWMTVAAFGRATPHMLAAGALGLLEPPELRRLRRAWDFLWTVRFHMHYVAGRVADRLTFDLQPVVGARMGYTRHGRQDGVERFMRHYFLTVRDVVRLTRVLEPALVREASGAPAIDPEPDAALREAGFLLSGGLLLPARSEDFEAEPVRMLRMLRFARDRRLTLHPWAVRALIRHERAAARLRGDAEAGALFLDLLTGRDPSGRPDSARWLAVLNETGVLSQMLPDWARIVGQMQFDSYHIFTVDEHTVEAVRVLNSLEVGALQEVAPVATGLLADLQSRRALYAAMLFHDIAKGRGGDHATIGADIVTAMGPTLGLSPEECETASWLVLNHLLLSGVAFKRDIDDPKTIADVADIVQSPELLRLLLVLTVADMRAVSPRIWNGWKAVLLRELYARVAEVLAGGLGTAERDGRVAAAREAVSGALLRAGWKDAERDAFLALGNPAYWLAFDPETHLRHARIVREAAAGDRALTVETDVLAARSATEVTVYAPDQPGLFARVAGAFALAGASIAHARVHTLANGRALDTFWVQDAAGGAFDKPHRLARLSVLIEHAVSGALRLPEEVAKLRASAPALRMRAIQVAPRVIVDNRASNTHSVIELNGRDRPGLLYDLATTMAASGVQIASAHITTYGVRAVDVFYVRDMFGLRIENARKVAAVRDSLLAMLERDRTDARGAEVEALPA